VLLRTVGSNRLALPDTDLDTGQLPTRGVNQLADDTYDAWMKKLAKKRTALSPEMRRAVDDHYRTRSPVR
jgi:hypothetical protein